MDDEQAPWWTRPPEPPPGTAGDAADDPDSAEIPTGELAFDDIPRRDDHRVPAVTPLPPLRRSDIVTQADPVDRPTQTAHAPSTTMTLAAEPLIPDPLPELTQQAPSRTPPPRPPVRALLAAALVVLAVIAVAGVVRWATGGAADERGTSSAVGATQASGQPDPKIAASLGGVAPAELTLLPDEEASQLLEQAGQGDAGSVVEAYSWTDVNGRNLVATTTQDAGSRVDLRVTHVAGLDSSAKTLRVMRDPGLPDCGGKGSAGFTPGSLLVRHLDRDDVADVSIGWTATCPGDEPGLAKLALITGGDKYILRGEGVVGTPGSGTPDPEPAAGSWPKDYLPALTRLFRQLYF